MKQHFVWFVLALVILGTVVGCGPSEKAVATAMAAIQATEDFNKQQTQTAEARILEQTKSVEETEQAVFAQETEQAQFARETEQAILGLTKTAEALTYAQTQTAIPRECTPGGSYVDFEGDASKDMVDIVKAETSLEGENLTVTMYVKALPAEITINAAEKGYGEISWSVNIDVDNDPLTGSNKNYETGSGLEYTLQLFHFSWGTLQTGPIEQVMGNDVNVWKFTEEGTSSIGNGTLSVDYETNSLTIKGRVPGLNEESRLYFVTGLSSEDDTLCD